MFDLSPVKILLVVIVAVVLVGPDKLPVVARQLGAGWRRLRSLHEQLDREIRENIPDLPSTQEIARFARSPVALLNQLAHTKADDLVEDPAAEPSSNGAAWPQDPTAAPTAGPTGPPPTAVDRPLEVTDDPNLN
jgi:sec-independent protein translocase protein TatB